MPETAKCLNCGAAFSEGAISRKKRFAECGHCGSIHNIAALTNEPASFRPIALPSTVEYGESLDGSSLTVYSENPGTLSNAAAGLIGIACILAIATVLMIVMSGPSVLVLYAAVPVVPAFAAGWFLGASANARMEILVDTDGVHVARKPGFWRRATVHAHTQVKCVLGLPLPDGAYELVLLSDGGRKTQVAPGPVSDATGKAVVYLLEHALQYGRDAKPEPSTRPRASKGTAQVAMFRRVSVSADLPRTGVQQMDCPSCGAPIALPGIDREDRSAACDYCGVVSDASAFLKVPRVARRDEYLPPTLKLTRSADMTHLHVGLPGHLVDKWGRLFFSGLLLIIAGNPVAFILTVPLMESFLAGAIAVLAVTTCGCGLIALAFRTSTQNPTHDAVLDGRRLKRISKRAGDPNNFDWSVSSIREFLCLRYQAAEAEYKFAVIAERADGDRRVVAAELESCKFGLNIAEAFNQQLGRSTAKTVP